MSDEDQQGRRRVDRILAEGFGDDLAALSLAELHDRRDDCLNEREFLSYLRRLLQGRLEILRAEQQRRADGVTDDRPIEQKLAEIFAQETPQAPGRGEALRVELPEEEMMLARRRIERVLNDSAFSDPASLNEDQVGAAILTLAKEEREVSDLRRTVMDLMDGFQDEVKRRYTDQMIAEGLRG